MFLPWVGFHWYRMLTTDAFSMGWSPSTECFWPPVPNAVHRCFFNGLVNHCYRMPTTDASSMGWSPPTDADHGCIFNGLVTTYRCRPRMRLQWVGHHLPMQTTDASSMGWSPPTDADHGCVFNGLATGTEF